MKTIKFLFTATVMAFVAFANAVEKPKVNVVPLSANQAVVSIQNENAAYFELSIQANNGDLVYYKYSRKPLTDYQKIFDFKNLQMGSYLLNLRINDTRVSKSLTVSSEGISSGETKLRFDPYFAFDGTALKFSFLNFDKEDFKFSLYENGDLIYQSKLGNAFNLSSGYDLSKLENGEYRAVLSSYNDEFDFSLEK